MVSKESLRRDARREVRGDIGDIGSVRKKGFTRNGLVSQEGADPKEKGVP